MKVLKFMRLLSGSRRISLFGKGVVVHSLKKEIYAAKFRILIFDFN
jgi:hypothetical protein